MQEDVRVVGLRRLNDRRGMARIVRGKRAYELGMSDGTLRSVSFGQLNTLLKARRFPADFWACVSAADSARDHLGDHEVPRMTPWPNG